MSLYLEEKALVELIFSKVLQILKDFEQKESKAFWRAVRLEADDFQVTARRRVRHFDDDYLE